MGIEDMFSDAMGSQIFNYFIKFWIFKMMVQFSRFVGKLMRIKIDNKAINSVIFLILLCTILKGGEAYHKESLVRKTKKAISQKNSRTVLNKLKNRN